MLNLQTMADRGYNPLVAIQMALSGQIYAETGGRCGTMSRIPVGPFN